jgi:hypothetical protein
MTLKMRPTGLGSGSYKDSIDYSVFSGRGWDTWKAWAKMEEAP